MCVCVCDPVHLLALLTAGFARAAPVVQALCHVAELRWVVTLAEATHLVEHDTRAASLPRTARPQGPYASHTIAIEHGAVSSAAADALRAVYARTNPAQDGGVAHRRSGSGDDAAAPSWAGRDRDRVASKRPKHGLGRSRSFVARTPGAPEPVSSRISALEEAIRAAKGGAASAVADDVAAPPADGTSKGANPGKTRASSRRSPRSPRSPRPPRSPRSSKRRTPKPRRALKAAAAPPPAAAVPPTQAPAAVALQAVGSGSSTMTKSGGQGLALKLEILLRQVLDGEPPPPLVLWAGNGGDSDGGVHKQ